MATKWGIVGCGFISGDFAAALKYLGKTEHQIVAVSARKLEDAETFAKKYGADKAYNSYQQIAENPNVEIVYIGVITSQHYSLTKLMLDSGKHVLCEKALCTNSKEVKNLVQLAREKKLFLMEAIWSRCFPAYRKIEELIENGSLGEVLQVNATFGKPIEHVARVTQAELGGGVMFDIGIYTIQLTTLAFGRKKPTVIKAVGDVSKDGVDLSAAVSLSYENGGIASLNSTVKADLTNNAFIIGTKGVIELKDPFWCTERLVLPDKTEFVCKLPEFSDPVHFGNSEGLLYEAQEVRRCLLNGLKESPLLPLDESIIIAEIIEEVRKQLGTY
ncbi:hypothetical protein CHUAL_001013 [Chamberlinius hualienensis]